MVALALSGLLGVMLVGGSILRTGWLPFDHLLAVAGLMWLGSAGAVLAVTGIANSVNIIDGMNGLASMTVAMTTAALAYIAWRVGDDSVPEASWRCPPLARDARLLHCWNYPPRPASSSALYGGAYLLVLHAGARRASLLARAALQEVSG